MSGRGRARGVVLSAAAALAGVALEWVLVTGGLGLPAVGAVPGPGTQADAAVHGSAAPAVASVALRRPDFQTGMTFPQWGMAAYGPADGNWRLGLTEIRQQTGARWVEMTVDFRQPSQDATVVRATPTLTPTPASVVAGIRLAHQMGYRVLLVPLVTVGGRAPWSGTIPVGTPAHALAWFHAYFAAFRPYVAAAARAGVDELAIGTELWHLEAAPSPLWTWLIHRIHHAYRGPLLYDMNSASLAAPVRPWMRSPDLSGIGVTMWIPVTRRRMPVSQARVTAMWGRRDRRPLDRFARALGRPVVVTEVGYRDTADCLVSPAKWRSSAPKSLSCQAEAYAAVLRNLLVDPHVRGVFFWAWSVPPFQPNYRPAAAVLRRWFTSSAA